MMSVIFVNLDSSNLSIRGILIRENYKNGKTTLIFVGNNMLNEPELVCV